MVTLHALQNNLPWAAGGSLAANGASSSPSADTAARKVPGNERAKDSKSTKSDILCDCGARNLGET